MTSSKDKTRCIKITKLFFKNDLAGNYDGIVFIENNGDPHNDPSEVIRECEDITGRIPDWKEKMSFERRLQLIEEYLCHPESSSSPVRKSLTRIWIFTTNILSGSEFCFTVRYTITT